MAGIADLAARSLELEVRTWPKPGLVSPFDAGSHADMDIGTFRRSAAAIQPHFHALADAGAQGCAMGRLRIIGLEAEAAMLAATGGVNTHRGAIFGLGLLCAAAGAQARARPIPRCRSAPSWRAVGRRYPGGPALLHSHGGDGAPALWRGRRPVEAAQGFPSVYEVGLPALRAAPGWRTGDAEAARVQACFALIAAVADTNLLHRGGLAGLRFAQRAARVFLEEGGVGRRDWRERAVAVHRAFVARRLSPGGSADLLAMSLFVQACEAEG